MSRECDKCGWRKAVANRKGVKIPGGSGKCCRPEGFCRSQKEGKENVGS